MKKTVKINRYTFTASETSELIDAAQSRRGALDLAILQAQDRARLDCMPAQWEAYYSPKNKRVIVVTRKHN